jgi:hypothetical protein
MKTVRVCSLDQITKVLFEIGGGYPREAAQPGGGLNMKLFILATVLLLMSAASLAETPPGGAAPPATSGATSDAKAPPGAADAQARPGAKKASGNSCRKAALGTCKGCSITCSENQKAVCAEPLYSWNSNKCVRDAACSCKARRT